MNNQRPMVIRIKNLRLRTIIGVNDWEREQRQDVVINAELEFDGRRAVETDDIDETINYKTLTKRIVSEVEQSSFHLVEKLAHHVVEIAMEDRRIMKVSVEVDKPGALRYADSVSLRCTAEREK